MRSINTIEIKGATKIKTKVVSERRLSVTELRMRGSSTCPSKHIQHLQVSSNGHVDGGNLGRRSTGGLAMRVSVLISAEESGAYSDESSSVGHDVGIESSHATGDRDREGLKRNGRWSHCPSGRNG